VGYARFSPPFRRDEREGLYVGGPFWNGRAATLAEQAMGPPLNPREMAMPSQWAVVSRLRENPVYVAQFRTLYDIDLEAIPANATASEQLSHRPGPRRSMPAWHRRSPHSRRAVSSIASRRNTTS
jgi:cytochrome c peroxidase